MRRLIYMVSLACCLTASGVRADEWPQWLGPQRDGVWRETGIIENFPPGGPKVRWRHPVGEGYSGPAVADGKVFVSDRVLAKGVSNPTNTFDRQTRINGKERVLCLDEAKGSLIWKYEYDCPYRISYAAGPRTTPLITQGKVYTLGAMGDLVCLDAASGAKVWHRKLADDYQMDVPMWGFAGQPLVDGDRLICLVGGKGSVVVAFNKDTGKEIWKALGAREPGYAPPMIYTFGGKRQLILWHPQAVNSLDPETGSVYWSVSYGGSAKNGVKAGMSIPSPRQMGDDLFLTCFYDGSLMLKTNGTHTPTVVWRSMGRGEKPDETESLHAVMNTPIIKDGYIYGVDSYGELRCLKAATGERVWSTLKYTTDKPVRWGNAFLVEQGGRFILYNEKGELIIAELTPKGDREISRAKILEPTNTMAGRPVVWSHPAFADRCVFARNDREIVCVSMAAEADGR